MKRTDLLIVGGAFAVAVTVSIVHGGLPGIDPANANNTPVPTVDVEAIREVGRDLSTAEDWLGRSHLPGHVTRQLPVTIAQVHAAALRNAASDAQQSFSWRSGAFEGEAEVTNEWTDGQGRLCREISHRVDLDYIFGSGRMAVCRAGGLWRAVS